MVMLGNDGFYEQQTDKTNKKEGLGFHFYCVEVVIN
jgi:hypothetical protein